MKNIIKASVVMALFAMASHAPADKNSRQTIASALHL